MQEGGGGEGPLKGINKKMGCHGEFKKGFDFKIGPRIFFFF